MLFFKTLFNLIGFIMLVSLAIYAVPAEGLLFVGIMAVCIYLVFWCYVVLIDEPRAARKSAQCHERYLIAEQARRLSDEQAHQVQLLKEKKWHQRQEDHQNATRY